MTVAGVRRLRDVRMADVAEVGGKAASLGELLAAGVSVPDGVVLTADAAAMTADERRSLLWVGAGDLGVGPFAVRSRILDATGPLMARGVARASPIPAVAREAGVWVPTVYRHFATKQQLIEAIYPHVMRRAAHQPTAAPALDLRASGRCARVPRVPGFARQSGACGHG